MSTESTIRMKPARDHVRKTLATLISFVFFAILGLKYDASVHSQVTEASKVQYVGVGLGNRTIKATLANTGPLRVEGLLGWTSINDESGMLLDFVMDGIYAIHMQGMRFPIDAIWIDSSDSIRLIYENIQPDSGVTYPSLFPSRYCLEVKAGFCKRFNVRSGQKVLFGVYSPKN